MTDEFAAADATIDQTIDQMVFERCMVAAEEIENAIIFAHGFSPFPFFCLVNLYSHGRHLWVPSLALLENKRRAARSRTEIRLRHSNCHLKFGFRVH